MTTDTSGCLSTYREHLLERGMAPTTVQQRMKFARARLAEWGTWDVPAHELAEWLGAYRGWTKVTYHGHLRSLYAWATEQGLAASDPTANFARPPSPRPRPKPLSEDELRLTLEHATPDVRTWLLLGYLAGLRAHEIAKFDGQDITRTGVYVLGKGGQGWTVPTHPLLWELAGRYPRAGYWFPSPFADRDHISTSTVTHGVGKLFRSLGLTGATHRARHTYGTQLLRGGANLRVVQELMRHASLSTTALYLGVDEDEKWTAINGLGA